MSRRLGEQLGSSVACRQEPRLTLATLAVRELVEDLHSLLQDGRLAAIGAGDAKNIEDGLALVVRIVEMLTKMCR